MYSTAGDFAWGTWPRCWRVVSWVILVLTILACDFLVLLYSMQWGRDVSEEWLSSFMLSFLQSILVVDPFKVLRMGLRRLFDND